MGVRDVLDDRAILDLANEAHDFFTSARDRKQVADQRHQELLRVHQQGWKQVADALYRGLSEIAAAIRSSR